MRRNNIFLLLAAVSPVAFTGPVKVKLKHTTDSNAQITYRDTPYLQEYSIRYLADSQQFLRLHSISVNRDSQIRLLSDKGLIVPDNGSLFYPGQFVRDVSYSAVVPKKITAIASYLDQTIYLDNKQVFSNAWAGTIQIDHGLPGACIFAGGSDFHFLVSDGKRLVYLNKNGDHLWSGYFPKLKQIRFRPGTNSFLLVSPETVAEWSPGQAIKELFNGSAITCATDAGAGKGIVVGTSNGYILLDEKQLTGRIPVQEKDIPVIDKLPCKTITCTHRIGEYLWFGSEKGAYRLNADGKYSYYAAGRWLPDNHVLDITEGPDNTVLVLTKKGLAKICRKKMTLQDKAMFFEKQVREKNIRYGINCSVVKLINSYSSAQTANQPSDNLWTGMYLASQLYRYKVTGSEEAKENAYEAFEALERMHTVAGVKGLFARSFERDYKVENDKGPGWQQRELHSGSPANLWLPAADHHNWTWRSTASSDQAVGQIFALTAILELADDKQWKDRALKCLDDLMGYIVDNNLYIIDVDGQPTMWGKWNPDYVNSFDESVGDRKITSSNIIAFLQTAYRFTGKEKYRKKAYELMGKYGYLDNLMRPMSAIGPHNGDELSKALSHEWNHSDDEMYFLAYWGLFPYAFTPELKEKYRSAIKDHWNMERPEHDPLWNFTYAMTGAKDFDLDPSIWFLKGYPLDLRNWSIHNSTRGDLDRMPDNFRGQTTRELLPLGEIPLCRHNAQVFRLDAEGDGKSLISAGDTWLLPYWMGRYLGVISAPDGAQ